MRDPELYLIKLFRKAIHKAENEEAQESAGFDISQQSENNNYDGNGELSFLAMDYFDALMPQKVKIGDDMNAFMDIFASPDKKLSRHDIAMQSIPIYCSEKDIEKYDYPVPVFVKEKGSEELVPLYGNPFEEAKYPYLSLVQVYISPEIMARIDSDMEEKSNRDNNVRNLITGSVIDQFYEDLHMIIEDYVREHYQRDRFRCRIYRSMSAGDFTVAISSYRPETAFILATLFRERGCYYKDRTVNKRKYVFYKTYTLLSCDNRWIHGDHGDSEDRDGFGEDGVLRAFGEEKACEDWTQSPSAGKSASGKGGNKRADMNDEFNIDGRFVLRVTFNNKYWGDAAESNVKHGYSRLNGRYDFSVELKEAGFRYLSKVLCEYKFGDGSFSRHYVPDAGGADAEISAEDRKTCEALIDLIRKSHIAYINERYTFTCDNMEIYPETGRETKIRLREDTKQQRHLLTKINQDRVEEVEKRLDRVYVKMMSLDTNRRNILYHLSLLKRMLNLCRSINGLSDTRIYCSILIQQIDIVIDGVEDFYFKLENDDNRYLVSIMEHAFVEAVDALNTYSKLIRDNNLQSLQTPNYNLESSVSVEKILVGYGELLNSLFKWYEGTKVCEEIYGLRQHYIPFMIPGGEEESLRTKVLFKEVKATVSNNKLMVVWSAAFSDLTNFGGTVGILFHEVAHNLRYRGRSERNNIILKYCTFLICDQIALSIVDNLEQNIPDLMDSVGLTRLICDSFYEAYDQVVYSDREAQMYIRDFSYNSVSDFIENEYAKFTEAVRHINNIDKFRRRCAILRPKYKNPRRDEALEKVKRLRDILVTGIHSSFGRKTVHKREEIERILAYKQEAIEALELYIQENEDENGNYIGDISAKTIYSSLLADAALGDDFLKMLDRYGLVDRFFLVLLDRLDANAEKAESSGDSGRTGYGLSSEVRKIRSFLTHGASDKEVDPGVLAAYVSPHIARTQMEAAAILKQFTFLYSEVASDLFMYNLVEMTPFGYFSFLSDYVPSDARIPHTYIRRFCTVMYGAFSSAAKDLVKADEKKRYWRGFVERVYNDYVKSTDRALDYLYAECKKFDDMRYVVPVKNKRGRVLQEPLSYWCGFIQAHIANYRDRYFDEMKENISFFDKCYKKEQGEGTIFADMEKIERRKNPDGENVDYFKNDDEDACDLTLQMILQKYSVEYFKFLRGYISTVYENISKDIGKIRDDLQDAACESGAEWERQRLGMMAEMQGLREKLHVLEQLQEEMTRWGFMASFLKRLHFEIHQEIVTIERKEYLADDYRIGYYNTRRLQDEFVCKGSNNGYDGRWMWSYFGEVKDILNHPERRYDPEDRKKTNKSMIEMISELHYRAIRNRAVDMVLSGNNMPV